MAVVAAGLVTLFWLLGLAADYLIVEIPFSYEQGLAESMMPDEVVEGEVPGYLRGLTQRLVGVMDLPEGMTFAPLRAKTRCRP